MYVPSLLPTLGLTLIATATAHSNGPRHPHFRRDLQVSNNLPSAWSSLGCYTDSVSARGLTSAYYASSDMSEESCIEFCDQKGYSFAGVEYSQECYCGYEIQSTSTQADESTCDMACGGDSSEPCGGPNRLNVFTNGVAPPAENPGVDGYTSLGCYSDSQTARTLSVYEPTSDGIVFVRSCVDICMQNGYMYAGVEYGQECYCGNTIQSPGAPIDSSSCNMPCSGNRTETCGGSNAINLYQNTASN